MSELSLEDFFGNEQETAPTDLNSVIAGLNPKQRQAVDAVHGPVLVVAGAGTGKTRVLTTRLASLIENHKISPSNIMAVTFTNKASAEMKERVAAYVGEKADQIWMGSFHSLSMRILKHHALQAGLTDSDFTIYDDDDQYQVAAEITRDHNLLPEEILNNGSGKDGFKKWVKSAISTFQNWKEEGLIPSEVLEHLDLDLVKFGWEAHELYTAYQKALLERNAVDFGDLIMHSLQLFKKDSAIRKRWSDQFRYIMIDEFQDTSPLQYQWLIELAKDHGNICAVGDVDQSIYEWRSARPEIMQGFEQDWEGCKVITVDINYRSTDQILKVANAIVENNHRISDKVLTSGMDGDVVELSVHDTNYREADAIVNAIEQYREIGVPSNQIAILFRSGALTRVFEQKLVEKDIRYKIVGSQKFYDRKEIKDAIAYLRLANDLNDDIAFRRIINEPRRDIGLTSVDRILKFKNENSGNMADTCEHASREAKGIRTQGRKNLLEFATLIRRANAFCQMKEKKPGELLQFLLDEVSYVDFYKKMNDERIDERETALKDMIRDADNYETVSEFLQQISLMSAADQDGPGDAISLMTIHAAKGLEFDIVFTPALEEGILPNSRSLDEPWGLAEERRIAHVAWTRARKKLHVSYARSRFNKVGDPSSFLKEAGLMNELPPPSSVASKSKFRGKGFSLKRNF